MLSCVDLEVGLHRRDVESYAVELRFSRPDSATDERVGAGRRPFRARFDLDQLVELLEDPAAYGALLTEGLFTDPAVREGFVAAYRTSQALDVPLRVRLFIGESALELHSLRWETLRNPVDGLPLIAQERLLFSRYLSSHDWRPVRLRPQGDLRALVVVANPSDLERYRLAAVDVEGEIERTRVNLGDIPVTTLASAGTASLEQLVGNLRDGYDILYLVCHGAVTAEAEPTAWLALEDEAGRLSRVTAEDFVGRLHELAQRPALIVLASCNSAGSESALVTLGPMLAEAGIPAILAMQGSVSMQTVREFMPIFFRELRRNGQIDLAVTVARGAVQARDDGWMPILFMRLRGGTLWYTPGFAPNSQGFRKWPALLPRIQEGLKCTPILGPGLLEPLIGTTRALARRWADTYNFPLAPDDRDDLPQVAQFLAINQDSSFPREQLGRHLRTELLDTYRDRLPAELHAAPFDRLLNAVGAIERQRNATEAHRVLAGFPFPIYVTANPDDLLEAALTHAGRDPQVALCPWNEYSEQLPSVYDREADYRPTADRPLVYHVFGHLREPESLVLTEDDYFNYLIGATRNKDLIPTEVRQALVNSALMFIGFELDAWNSRVLLHSLMGQQGRRQQSQYSHVGVQINPDEGRIIEPVAARNYLESYFQNSAISVYWGSTEDFMQELVRAGEGTPERAHGGLASGAAAWR